MSKDVTTILVVEDNQDNRTLIKAILSMMDSEIIEAEDGEVGVKVAVEQKPSLILMDLSLPQKDGWEATREIKANPDVAHIPIIALTAHAMLGDREKALEAGCNDYISKPVNMMELREKIALHLENAKQAGAAASKDDKVAGEKKDEPAKAKEKKADESKEKDTAADKKETDS